MKSFLYLLAGVLVVVAASWTYNVNYQVQAAEDRVASLQRQINRERSKIAVLGAEWAYLNRPERLRALAETYYDKLRLMPIDASHFAAIDDVPLPSDETAAAVQQIVARTN
jgi:hypothetical protein